MFLNICVFISIFVILRGSSPCGNSIVEPAEECDDGNTVSGDGCSSTCNIETDYKCYIQNNLSICYINKPFSAYLNYIPLSNIDLNLTFTKPFLVYNPNFIQSRMNLTIPGLNSSTDFTWQMQNTTDQMMFSIDLSFSVSFISQQVVITFNNSDSQILDIFNESLGEGSWVLTAEIPIYINYTSYEANFMVFMNYFIDFVFIIMMFSTIPLLIVNSLTVFWSFLGISYLFYFFKNIILDIVQLIQLFEYISYNRARQTIEFLRELRISNLFFHNLKSKFYFSQFFD